VNTHFTQLQKWSSQFIDHRATVSFRRGANWDNARTPTRWCIRSQLTYNWQWRRRESKNSIFIPSCYFIFFFLFHFFFLLGRIIYRRHPHTRSTYTHAPHTHCRHLPRTTHPLSKCLCTDRCSIPSGSPAFRSRGTPRPI